MKHKLHELLVLFVIFVSFVLFSMIPGVGRAESFQLKQDPGELVWPLPPTKPRIKYVTTISSNKDVEVKKKGFFRRLLEFITGEHIERVMRPYGVYVEDSKGLLIVTDPGLGAFHIFDIKGKGYRKVKRLKGDDFLISPIGVTMDGKGRIFVTDSEKGSIYLFNKKGKFLGRWGEKDGLKRPTGIAYNKKNRLIYLVDTLRHEVLIYNLEGGLEFRFGKRGEKKGEFNSPTHIAVDRRGRIYVTDSMNFRIQIFDPEGNFISMFGELGDAIGDFSKPKGVAVNSKDYIFVVESFYDNILIFDREGRVLLNWGRTGEEKGMFWLPAGIFIDGENRIYIADTYNRRVQVFQYIGEEIKK